MILRRFTKHVTEQNWFAVGLDVLVVIVGIFLGMQVTDWNEDRQNRVLESTYLVQLHDEIDSVYGPSKIASINRDNISMALSQILENYKKEERFMDFSKQQCSAVSLSHIIQNIVPALSSLNELQAVGGSAIISNDDLRRLISAYKNSKEVADRMTLGGNSNNVMLSRKYPLLIDMGGQVIDIDINQERKTSCNMDLINQEPGFKNDLIDATSRYSAFARSIHRQLDALQELHTMLDQQLSITHEDQTS